MLMKTKLLLTFLLLTATLSLSAQSMTFTVKGVALDSLTRRGEAYATVAITRKSDADNLKSDADGLVTKTDSLVAKSVTDKNGRFNLTLNGESGYVVTVSALGCAAISRDFTCKQGQKTIDAGTFLLAECAQEVSGVEVVARKPLVKADIDKIEYSVEDDPDAQHNTVIEMLRKVPMVTVDGEDNIQVNGSSSFKVYVNGKPNNMMTNNPKEVLKSMPANSIKKIEVITNPGPKYDVEGVGGILNIITVGKGMEGYTATFSAYASNQGSGGGAFATVQVGKFVVSGNLNYRYDYSPSSDLRTTIETTPELADATSSDSRSEWTSRNRGNNYTGSLEASYEIDTLRLVTASFSCWGGNSQTNSDGSFAATSPLTGSSLYSYTPLTHTRSSRYMINGGIDYQRTFSVKDRLLTFSYRVSTMPRDNRSHYTYDDAVAEDEWQDFLQRIENQRTDGHQNTLEHTFQIDYTTPFAQHHKLEAGAKYIYRNNHSEDDRYTQPLLSAQDFAYDEQNSSHYEHRNDIIAAYLGYGLNLKKWSGRLGLRYEHTLQDVKYLVGQGDDFHKNLDDLVPSASIGYKLTDMRNLRLGYNMRIYRPSIYFLNPYLDQSTPSSLSQGNSRLDTEKSHSFSLSFSNFTPKVYLSASLGYSFTNNSIEGVTQLVDDTKITGVQNPTGKKVLYTTYENIGKTKSVQLSGFLNWNITNRMRFTTNAHGSYTNYDNGTDMKNHGWSVFAYGSLQQTLNKDWVLSAIGFYFSPGPTLQGRGNRYYTYGLSATKSFLKKRLTLTASAHNFVKPRMKYSSYTETATFSQHNDSWGTNGRFSLSVSYRIGELKASVRKAERSIENDDVKSNGSGK